MKEKLDWWNKKFTDEELIYYYNEGFYDKQIAIILGCTRYAILRRRWKLGLEANGRGCIPNQKIHTGKEIKEAYKKLIKKEGDWRKENHPEYLYNEKRKAYNKKYYQKIKWTTKQKQNKEKLERI